MMQPLRSMILRLGSQATMLSENWSRAPTAQTTNPEVSKSAMRSRTQMRKCTSTCSTGRCVPRRERCAAFLRIIRLQKVCEFPKFFSHTWVASISFLIAKMQSPVSSREKKTRSWPSRKEEKAKTRRKEETTSNRANSHSRQSKRKYRKLSQLQPLSTSYRNNPCTNRTRGSTDMNRNSRTHNGLAETNSVLRIRNGMKSCRKSCRLMQTFTQAYSSGGQLCPSSQKPLETPGQRMSRRPVQHLQKILESKQKVVRVRRQRNLNSKLLTKLEKISTHSLMGTKKTMQLLQRHLRKRLLIQRRRTSLNQSLSLLSFGR